MRLHARTQSRDLRGRAARRCRRARPAAARLRARDRLWLGLVGGVLAVLLAQLRRARPRSLFSSGFGGGVPSSGSRGSGFSRAPAASARGLLGQHVCFGLGGGGLRRHAAPASGASGLRLRGRRRRRGLARRRPARPPGPRSAPAAAPSARLRGSHQRETRAPSAWASDDRTTMRRNSRRAGGASRCSIGSRHSCAARCPSFGLGHHAQASSRRPPRGRHRLHHGAVGRVLVGPQDRPPCRRPSKIAFELRARAPRTGTSCCARR